MKTLYLDYNATTPIAPAVREAMLPFLVEHYGNPSSGHALGRVSHEAVERARGQVAALLGAEPDEVIFTSGGTEANNMALVGAVLQNAPPIRGHVVISALEHPAVVEPARFLERMGCELTVIGCDCAGVLDPAAVDDALRPDTVLVSIMLANNEIGTLQPVRRIAASCRARGVLCHTDAAQAVGKIPVRVDELGVDMLSIAGHKVYAPKGVGALYLRRGVRIEPVMHGAGHEGGRRPGTENVPYLVALGTAASLAAGHLKEHGGRLAELRDRLYRRLAASLPPEHGVNGAGAPRLPNTLSINFPGVVGSELLARAAGLCASTGTACHSGKTSMSATLSAIGLAPDVARGTVRLSVGWMTGESEIDLAASRLLTAWRQLV